MKIITTVKRVTNPDAKAKLSPDGAQILPQGLEYKLNDFDEYGVEEAVRLKEKHGGEVIVVCVGTKDAVKDIRYALAMGGDRAIRVDVDAETIDAGTVAKLIAKVVANEGADLVVTGKLSVDSENNQVAQRIAGHLNWPQATFAYSCDIADGWATVGREVDGGSTTVRFKLPGVITADLRLNEPRYAKLPNIMKAKRKKLDVVSAGDLGVDLATSITTVGYELPPAREAGEIVPDVATLVSKLANEAKVV